MLGAIAVPGAGPKLAHAAKLPTNHPVAALLQLPDSKSKASTLHHVTNLP
jgi:hypothetical protein